MDALNVVFAVRLLAEQLAAQLTLKLGRTAPNWLHSFYMLYQDSTTVA